MRMLKKAFICLLVLSLLAAVPTATATAAAADFASVVGDEILQSITVEETTGNGLAFLITMNVQGAKTTVTNELDVTNATVTVGGATYKVVSMGAVMVNDTAVIRRGANALTLEDVNEERTIIDVPARYMWTCAEDYCSFAVRIIRLPDAYVGRAIACRPYCIVEDADGQQTTVYGGMDVGSYNTHYYDVYPEEIPTWNLTVPNLDARTEVTAVAAEYCALSPSYEECFKLSLSLTNVTKNAQSAVDGWVSYTCYDAKGTAIGTAKAEVGEMAKGSSKSGVEMYVPVGTASLEVTENEMGYVPVLTLPAVGSDIDITKKKDRIHITAISAAFTEDDTILVTMTVKNSSSQWITQETDTVSWASYELVNGANKIRSSGKLSIGCIDTKKNKQKTYTIEIAGVSTLFKLTASSITYWTEWS